MVKEIKYSITVCTGERAGAGTDSAAWVTLIGDQDEVGPIKISRTLSIRTHHRSSQVTYSFNAGSVGTMWAMKLETRNGLLFSGWWIRQIQVEDSGAGQTYHFPVFSWVEDETVRYFFCGAAMIPNNPAMPLNVRSLRKSDLCFWRHLYASDNFVRNDGLLPTGMSNKYVDLPLNERFDSRKLFSFSGATIEVAKDRGLVKFLDCDNSWDSFEEMKESLYRHFDVPNVLATWRNDETFGRQIVLGVNPVSLQLCRGAFPDGMDVSVNFLSNVPVLADKDINEELRLEKFVYVDYRDCLGKVVARDADERFQRPNTPPKYLTAPVLLLYYNALINCIVPVAIQLKDGGKVYTPARPNASESEHNEWLLAKMHFNCADSQVHQALIHLLRTHLVMEPFAIATHCTLSQAHPIFKLLKPHLKNTGAINTLARETLLDQIEELFSIGDGLIPFLQQDYETWSLLSQTPPEDLAARGFGPDSTEREGEVNDVSVSKGEHSQRNPLVNVPGAYPWREDALLVFEAIKKYVKTYVQIYYQNDADLVKQDEEIQQWRAEILGLQPGKPFPMLDNVQSLIDVCTAVIWTTSCGHASVNFNQYEFYGWQPNRPVVMRKCIPEEQQEGTVFDETNVMETLPDMNSTVNAMGLAYILSHYADNEVYLGHWDADLLEDDPAAQEVKAQFTADMNAITSEISKRNATNRQDWPYRYLMPSKVPNSIAI